MNDPATPSPSRRTGRELRLDALELAQVRAHEGAGLIGFRRIFGAEDFASACDFADYAVLPPGSSIGVHRHGDDEELYLVLEGEGTMTLDGRTFRVGRGSVVLNRAGGEHGLVNDGATPLKIFVIQVALKSRAASGAESSS